MADNVLVVQIDLEKGDVSGAFKSIEKDAEKSGKKSGKEFSEGFEDGLKGLLKIASIASAAVGAVFSAASINNAIAQEDAVNRLNTALTISGDFSKKASQDFQELASSIQQTTRFGDELILNQIALAKSFGATNEQAKEIAQTSTDLAEAFGIDLESATRNVSKTLGGFAGELGEVIPELKELTKEQLQAGEGIKLLSEAFGGTAASRVRTFGGALQQLLNSFGDFTEEIGFIFTKSPVLIKTINLLSKGFADLGRSLNSFVGGNDVFGSIALGAVNFGKVIINNVIKPIEILFNILSRIGNTISPIFINLANLVGQTFQTIVDTIQPVLQLVGKSVDFVFEKISEKTDALTADGGFFAGVLDNTALSESLLEGLNTIENFTKQAKPIVKDFKNTAKDIGDPLVKNLSQTTKQANQLINSGLAGGLSRGIQSIVSSLAKGENAFENFGKVLLNIFGDLAIQLGTFYIAQGLATQALLNSPAAPLALVAAGAGLVALGAILKAFGGSNGASAAPSSGGGAGGAEFATQPSQIVEDEDFERDTAATINLNVEGSLVQQEELGTYISDVLSESNQKNGNVILAPSFA